MAGSEDQSEVIAFLDTPDAFGGTGPVRRVDTHFSVVFMAGDRVFKLKRALVNPLLDHGTVARRRASCLSELEINRRTAPSLYLDVLPVTREHCGGLALDGRGEPVDWVVAMERFDEDTLFSRMAERGALTRELIDGTADAVARLHEIAEPVPERGGVSDMAWIVDGNLSALGEATGDVFEAPEVRRLHDLTRGALERRGELLERRREGGFVRRCHGDLHLGNLCLVEGAPTLFDAIEFNDRIACCDVLYDLAFLVMDLWFRGERGHANRVLNRYLWRTADWEGLALVPLFLSCRAAVRAKTSAWAAGLQDIGDEAGRLRDEARAYLALAQDTLDRPAPDLVAVGGLSGTGKSTLAMALAPGRPGIPGAVILRSDVLRKQLAGVPFERHLEADSYAPGVTAEVYDRLDGHAGDALSGDLSVIADAVFARPNERAAIARVAALAGVAFHGIWLDAPQDERMRRVTGRGPDASDADARIVALQAAHDTGPIAWQRIESHEDREATAAAARALL